MTTWQDRFHQCLAESTHATVKEACDAAGMTPSTFNSALKSGRLPKPSTMEKMARVLNTTTQYLMFGDSTLEVPVSFVPVLNRSHLDDWYHRKSIKSVQKVPAPIELSADAFAWRIDVPTMEPELPRGALAYCEPPPEDLDELDYHRRNLVLSVSSSIRDKNHPVPRDASWEQYVLDFSTLCLHELVLSSERHRLVCHHPGFPSLPLSGRAIVAVVKSVTLVF